MPQFFFHENGICHTTVITVAALSIFHHTVPKLSPYTHHQQKQLVMVHLEFVWLHDSHQTYFIFSTNPNSNMPLTDI